jgi:hypothetical protein
MMYLFQSRGQMEAAGISVRWGRTARETRAAPAARFKAIGDTAYALLRELTDFEPAYIIPHTTCNMPHAAYSYNMPHTT